MRTLVVFLVALSCAAAQKIKFGECPDVPVQANFDLSKYTGTWYEIEKNPVPFEAGRKCMSATYEDKGDYVSVVNRGIVESTGEESSIQGKATIPDPNEPAKLLVQFNSPIKGNYWVLNTDYENYSLVYSCFSVLNIFHGEYVWILARQSTLDDAIKQNVYKVLDDNKIDKTGLVATRQDCS